jgi:hypothetical protein
MALVIGLGVVFAQAVSAAPVSIELPLFVAKIVANPEQCQLRCAANAAWQGLGDQVSGR